MVVLVVVLVVVEACLGAVVVVVVWVDVEDEGLVTFVVRVVVVVDPVVLVLVRGDVTTVRVTVREGVVVDEPVVWEAACLGSTVLETSEAVDAEEWASVLTVLAVGCTFVWVRFVCDSFLAIRDAALLLEVLVVGAAVVPAMDS